MNERDNLQENKQTPKKEDPKKGQSIRYFIISPIYYPLTYALDSLDITFLIKRKISNSYFSLMSGLSSFTLFNYLGYTTSNKTILKPLGLSLVSFPVFYIFYKIVLDKKSFFKKGLALGCVVGLTAGIFTQKMNFFYLVGNHK